MTATAAAADLTVRALLFDMDGTLVNSDAVVERVWSRWALRNGLDPALVLPVIHGRQAHASMAQLLPERPLATHRADAARLNAEETADVAGVVPIPGAPALLAAVAALPHALVTSADTALAAARMGAAGLPLPEVRITAESVSASKPDPEGFLKAAAELGVDPEDCLVFEDSGAGIAAGHAAGMRVVGVGPRAAAHGPTVWAPTLERVHVEPQGEAGGALRVRVHAD
ncbi:HAD-IA family hydrolase [Streptomyces sp. 4N509B]|uniref:HAD-IA family hydrolase n=1 Tax=Streptomyces sp. 4N509B TaxID=3457413 RepID=UPI003FD10613